MERKGICFFFVWPAGFHQVLFLRLDFVLFIDIADKLHTSEECLEILMRSPRPGDLRWRVRWESGTFRWSFVWGFWECIKNKYFVMRIWRYWFFWKYTVSHVIQYTLCCVGVFWMPITQKTDLFNLLWLYNSNIITSIYITSPTKQGVSSHYWWSRSIPGDSSRDLLIPQFEVPSNLQKGHLTIPKRSQRIARYI